MRQFNRKHDVIFWYSKGDKWTFNGDKVRLPYKDAKQSLRRGMSTTGKFTKQEVEQYRNRGKIPETWWTDIAIAVRSKKENTGYKTQKPLKLLTRIIKASSDEGDIVLDPFCGCATTCVAAQQLQRQWIGIDIEPRAPTILMERLSDDAKMFKNFVHLTEPPQRTDVEIVLPKSKSVRARLYFEQGKKCKGCGNEYLEKDFEVDHIIPRSKDGSDHYSNLQLLCGNCNKKKGDKPMEFLLARVNLMNEAKKQITFGL